MKAWEQGEIKGLNPSKIVALHNRYFQFRNIAFTQFSGGFLPREIKREAPLSSRVYAGPLTGVWGDEAREADGGGILFLARKDSAMMESRSQLL